MLLIKSHSYSMLGEYKLCESFENQLMVETLTMFAKCFWWSIVIAGFCKDLRQTQRM
jgi:hypothetical protein